MCLAIPGRLAAITEGEGFDCRGTVDYDGARQEVALAYLPEAKVGDYVLVHVGFAMTLLDTDEAERILRSCANWKPADPGRGMGPGLYLHASARAQMRLLRVFSRAEPAAVESRQAGIGRELQALPADAPETIFIGGGTPTALEPDDLARLPEGIHHHTDVRNVVEWTAKRIPAP